MKNWQLYFDSSLTNYEVWSDETLLAIVSGERIEAVNNSGTAIIGCIIIFETNPKKVHEFLGSLIHLVKAVVNMLKNSC